MSPSGTIWFVGMEKEIQPDILEWTETHRCSFRSLSGNDLEHPDWQLAATAGPSLILTDVRNLDCRKKAVQKQVCEWLLLLRMQAWESPVVLCVSEADPSSLCMWGQHGVTEALIAPDRETIDKVFRNYLDRKHRQREPSGGVPLLAMLRESSAILATEKSGTAVWKRFLRKILRRFSAQSGSILLLNEAKNGLIPLAGLGLPPGIAEKPLLPLEGSITERVIREDRSLILHGTVKLSRFGGKELRLSPSSALAVPLRCGDQVLGSLNVSRRGKARRFSPPDLAALEILGSQVALAIENQRLIEQMVENERLVTVGRTTADISHSVKNLMTSLRGAVFLFEQGFRRSDQHLLGESLELLKRSINRMQRMIGDLLDFSKKREPFPSPVRLVDLFHEIERQIRYRCHEQNVELTVHSPDSMPLLMLEEDRLFRALMNLLDNALDAMPRKGILRMKAAWKPTGSVLPSPPSYEVAGVLEIDVADSGPGVAPELREKVFETFFSTKGGKGTGLGLAMVHKFAAESGGSVRILDAPHKTGALFRLRIPVAAVMLPVEESLATRN